jgi:hypothetical protein
MSFSTDDVAALVGELGASLTPSQYSAFAAAAHAALGNYCSGPGAAYRILRDLQKSYFDPPADARAISGARHQRSKLADGPPLDDDSARGRASTRSRWLRGWRG